MVDSELVGVGGEVAAGVADLPVVPEAGGEGEQAHPDAGAEAGQGAGAVAFEPELALAGPEDRFDALADVPSEPKRGCSSRRSGRSKLAPCAATKRSKSWPAKPLSATTA